MSAYLASGTRVRVRPSDPIPSLRGRSGTIVISPASQLDPTLGAIAHSLPYVDFGAELRGAFGVVSRVHAISTRHLEVIAERWYSCSCGASSTNLGAEVTVIEDGDEIDMASCPSCGQLAIAERVRVTP